MNNRLVRELMRKDLQEMLKNRYVLFSMLVLPVILLLTAIPSTVTLITIGSGGASSITNNMFTGIFVLIPAIITTTIGSTSIVLEKSNRSLEPLLGTPITDTELFAGKSLAPFLPAMGITLVTYAVYISVTDALTYHTLGHLMFPTYLTLIEMFFISPVTGFLGTFSSLFVSSKVKDVRSAQQVSGLAVLPVLLIMFIPMVAAGNDLLIISVFGVALLAAVALLALFTIRIFRRESILVDWT